MRRTLVLAMALTATGAWAGCAGDDDDDGGDAPDAASGTPDAASGTPDAGEDTPDAAAGACTSEMFDKYGVNAFLAVNDSIIEKAVAAPTSMIGTSFQDLAGKDKKRVEEFRANLAAFLVEVYGGPQDYEGPSMEEAHTGLDITSEQYDYFVAEVIVPALVENGVDEDDVADCFAPPVVDPVFKSTIVEE